ncbi:MAG: hypothetical protein JWM27_706 [Gemmatimonadetes bacterium]|nr:hypothetical protein [Gemmatimonadota bacterium]
MTDGGPAPGLIWIVGPGRVGLSLGVALHRAGAALAFSGRGGAIPNHPLLEGDPPAARWRGGSFAAPAGLSGIVVAVPDRAVREVAGRLASADIDRSVPVVHTSGALGMEALESLRAAGHPVGGVHPLAAVADTVDGADRLRGAAFGVEGEGLARALAERVVAACGGVALPIRGGGKPLYHAAAVFASNYAVALLAVAERLMEAAGVDAEDARPALAALAEGAVANVRALGPAAALTGPVARGDDETVRLHRARLSAGVRPLYSLLGREALALAERAGLDPAAVDRVRAALGDETP